MAPSVEVDRALLLLVLSARAEAEPDSLWRTRSLRPMSGTAVVKFPREA
jgi:hypothetical protein